VRNSANPGRLLAILLASWATEAPSRPPTTTSAAAAVTWARAHGAGRVTLVGASAGGIVALQAATTIRPPVDGVVE
jgi:pimeloyl-ACP methyl ester carboxylesterase